MKGYIGYIKIYILFLLSLSKVKGIVVQTEWVREAFSKKFKYPRKNIFTTLLELKKIDVENIKQVSREKYRIFYPAAPYAYKNHEVVVEALKGLKEYENKIECILL